MKKYIDQIAIVPIILLYYLIGLLFFKRIGLSIDYYIYGLFVLGGLAYKYLKNKFNNNKIIKIVCSIVIIVLISTIYLKTIVELVHGIYLGINNGSFLYIKESISKISTTNLLKNSLYLLSFVVIATLYDSLIVKKRINVFVYFALFISVIGGLLQNKTDFIVMSIFVFSLLLIVFKDSYNDINLLDYRKSLIIILIFACCAIFSYFLIPYAENINIREGINNARTNIGDFFDNIFNKNNFILDGKLSDMKISSDKEELSEEIIITIDTSYHIDRIKAYSCSKFDIGKNSFVMDENFIRNEDNDFTDLFIQQDGKDLSEYFHVFVNKNVDDVVYVPYGKLSFSEKVNLFHDNVIQFNKKGNYKEYTLTFNPYYYNELISKVSLLSKYKEYINKNYANNDSIPEEIIKSIDKFINEDEELYYSNINKNEIDSKSDEYKKVLIKNINDYINSKFIIKDEFTKNNMKINDISYALEFSHEANPQLLAAITMFMYRKEGIPSRYVVGYHAKDYQENTVYIHENDKTYWSEVFIDDHWIPSEDTYLFNSENEAINNQDKKIGSMDGNIDESFDDFSQSTGDSKKIVLSVESNCAIDRIKQSSYGDYNPIKQSFEYEEDINTYPSIQKIKKINSLDDYFNELYISKLKLRYYMKVTSYIDTNNAYVPYGIINMQDVSTYQDKAILLNSNKDSYLVNFEPYSKDRPYRTNSFYEDYVYEKYLTVPTDMIDELRDFLLSKGIDYTSKDKSLLIRQIKNLLQSKEYAYTFKPGGVPNGEDVLMYFLLNNKKGFCQHFAGAATLLYRICGIPSRYTVGFAIDDFENGVANLTASDAHAWVEVFTNNYGWKPVEVTGSRRYELTENENDYEFGGFDSDSINSIDSGNQSDAKYNTQPEIALENQTVEQNRTYIKDEITDNEDDIVLTIETNDKVKRVKRYSLGNYNVNNQKFFLGEDISSRKEIIKINNLYGIDSFFKSLFIVDDEQPNKINFKVNDDNKWVYVPYGDINIENVSLYQDKYLYFEDEINYDDYSISYSANAIKRNTNEMYDYENFVYNYYTEVPHDYEFILKDFLEEKNIDYDSKDKIIIIEKIQNLLINKYLYNKSSKGNNDGTDRTLNFIIRTREGDDELFTNGATMLLRLCGIPTRIANGYYLNDSIDGIYEVKKQDEHSWVEVYTSNYGWMPVEVCPKFEREDINGYKFERHYNEEDDIEFVDIQQKRDSKVLFITCGSIAIMCVVGVILIEIKKNQDEFNKKLMELGITSKEQLKLLRSINKNYLLLKNNGYVNDEIENIMLRIRFSKQKETEEDLKTILKQVEFMKKDSVSKWLFKKTRH